MITMSYPIFRVVPRWPKIPSDATRRFEGKVCGEGLRGAERSLEDEGCATPSSSTTTRQAPAASRPAIPGSGSGTREPWRKGAILAGSSTATPGWPGSSTIRRLTVNTTTAEWSLPRAPATALPGAHKHVRRHMAATDERHRQGYRDPHAAPPTRHLAAADRALLAVLLHRFSAPGCGNYI
jgi:hypothetical protein